MARFMVKPYILADEALADIEEIIQNAVNYTTYTSSGIKLYNELFDKFELLSLLPQAGKIIQEKFLHVLTE